MKILITGAKGFIGKNLSETLKTIRDGRNHTHPELSIEEVYEYDVDSGMHALDYYCREADFVFNLAGVNRPKDESEFIKENCGFVSTLLNTLKKYKNRCPVMLSSSIQASCIGRYADSEYGRSKRVAEDILLRYSEETGSEVYIFRFPNVFGKWCKPNYNSVVATFCFNIANDLPIRVDDRDTELEVLYIDDLVEAMISLLGGEVQRCEYCGVETVISDKGGFCFVPGSYKVTLGNIVDLLEEFHSQQNTLIIPTIEEGSFSKKLYSTYLSYLPPDKVSFPLKMNTDERGSFTEVLKSFNSGQFSINVSRPGVTKGQHWHNTKWEFFVVVSGHGLIQERKIGFDEILEFEVSGEELRAVHILPGYTHNLINLSDTEDLVTIIWANELFDAEHPDTFTEKV